MASGRARVFSILSTYLSVLECHLINCPTIDNIVQVDMKCTSVG